MKILSHILASFFLALLPLAAQDIEVFGGPNNDVEISNGDSSPRAADETLFADTVVNENDEATFRIKALTALTFTSITSSSSHFDTPIVPPPPLLAGGEATIKIVFNPTSSGLKDGTITISTLTFAGTKNFTFAVRGHGIGEPEATVVGVLFGIPTEREILDGDTSPSTADNTDFETSDYYTPTRTVFRPERPFRIRNSGTGTLTVSGTSSSNRFSILGLTSSVAPGGSDDFTIRFNPNRSGAETTTITLTTNDANEGTYTFRVRASARAPEVSVRGNEPSFNLNIADGDDTPRPEDGTDFGTRILTAGSDTHRFQIRNRPGTVPPFSTVVNSLTVTNFQIENASSNAFSVTGSFPAVVPGGNAEFTVSFNPSSIGEHTATVRFNTNDPDDGEGVYRFAVRGIGTGSPEVTVAGRPNILANWDNIIDDSTTPRNSEGRDFGSSPINPLLPTARTYRVRNTGSAPLTLNNLQSSSAQFRITEGLIPALAAGAEDFFTVEFRPTVGGELTSTIRFTTNDANENPFNFTVTGFSHAPEIQVFGGSGFSEEIFHDDESPTVLDGTDFGEALTTDDGRLRTFRIRNGDRDDKNPTTRLNYSVAVIGSNAFSVALLPPAIGFLDEGQEADFGIVFDPSTAGPHRATVRIAHNDPDGNESPFEFQVQGVGLGSPDLSAFGGSLPGIALVPIQNGDEDPELADFTDYGQVDMVLQTGLTAARHTFRVHNSGTADFRGRMTVDSPHFQIVGDGVRTIPVNRGVFFVVIFDPQAKGRHDATLTLRGTRGGNVPYTFAITGFAVGPEMEVRGGEDFEEIIRSGDDSPSDLDRTDFGAIAVTGADNKNTYRIFNTTSTPSAPLVITGVSVDNVNFSVVSPPFGLFPIAINPGASADIQIAFNPVAIGPHQAWVTINHNDRDGNEQPYRFLIQGDGDQPQMTFTQVAPGTGPINDGDTVTLSTLNLTESASTSAQLRLNNDGNVALNFNFAEDSEQFSINPASGSVDPGESQSIALVYSPNEAGTHNVEIGLTTNDFDQSPLRFTTQATSTAPRLVLTDLNQNFNIPSGANSPSLLDGTGFLDTEVGQSQMSAVLIRNTGSAPLTVQVTEDSVHFSTLFGEPTIEPGNSRNLGLIFEPQSSGEKSAVITLTSNDPDTPAYTFTIGGTALPANQMEGEITDFTFTSTVQSLRFLTAPSKRYRVMTSPNLKDWTALPDLAVIEGTGEEAEVDLAAFIAANVSPQCFFRIEEVAGASSLGGR